MTTPVAELATSWKQFRSVCVTGTHGKTTTTSMVEAIARAAGEPGARLTSLGAWVGEAAVEAEPIDLLEAFLARAAEAGCRTIAVEVVSLALATGFARSFPPDVAVFTNLMDSHRKLHGTREAYLAAKSSLFARLRAPGTAVLNACDPAAADIARLVPEGATVLAYAARAKAPACKSLPLALRAKKVKTDREGTQLALEGGPLATALGGTLSLGIAGAVNADNALAAALAGHAAGFAADAIARGLAAFPGVPGRFQAVSRRPWVVVDFAHTPDALRQVLTAVRAVLTAENAKGRLTCVFGCGGERNPERRAPLGEVAASIADRVIVTSDNPRREDPAAIAREIEQGFAGAPATLERHRELDRRRAIELAIADARPEDAIVIAGKGPETVQLVRGRPIPWSDVEVARGALPRAAAPGDDAPPQG